DDARRAAQPGVFRPLQRRGGRACDVRCVEPAHRGGPHAPVVSDRDRQLLPRAVVRTRKRRCVMEVIYILLPAALIFAAGAVAFFAWATRSGQFDDLETPALRMLGD